MTSAIFCGFSTPSLPLVSTKSTQPPLLSSEIGQPPPSPSLLTSIVNGPLGGKRKMRRKTLKMTK